MPHEPRHQARRCSQSPTESLRDVDHIRAQQARDGLRVALNATHAAARYCRRARHDDDAVIASTAARRELSGESSHRRLRVRS
eukprot:10427865-Heterocapsa_arctica.AAC.1